MEQVRTLAGATARLYQRVSASVILIGAFVCLVYFLGYFLLNSTFATQAFYTSVNRMFRGKITWTSVSWGPLPWQIRILEPTLLDSRGRPVVTAKTLSVDDFRILDRVNSRIAADGITLESPVIRLSSRTIEGVVDSMGQPRQVMNIAEMFWPEGPLYNDGQPGQTSLAFTGINIRNAMFVLDTDQTAIIAHNLRLTDGRFDLAAGAEPVMGIGAASVTIDRGAVRLATDETRRRPLRLPSGDTLDFPLSGLRFHQFSWVGMNSRFPESVAMSAVTNSKPSVLRWTYRPPTFR